MQKKIYVVEKECGCCGAPIGEGIINVREPREGDIFAARQVTDSEVPYRWTALAAAAHPTTAIKVFSDCGCED